MRIGSNYFGSSDIQTSIANEDIIQQYKPLNQTYQLQVYKFSFMNLEECHIKINNGNSIYLAANQGFESSEVDALIFNFVIIENNVQYYCVGAY